MMPMCAMRYLTHVTKKTQAVHVHLLAGYMTAYSLDSPIGILFKSPNDPHFKPISTPLPAPLPLTSCRNELCLSEPMHHCEGFAGVEQFPDSLQRG